MSLCCPWGVSQVRQTCFDPPVHRYDHPGGIAAVLCSCGVCTFSQGCLSAVAKLCTVSPLGTLLSPLLSLSPPCPLTVKEVFVFLLPLCHLLCCDTGVRVFGSVPSPCCDGHLHIVSLSLSPCIASSCIPSYSV